MAASKKRRPPPRDAGNGLQNATLGGLHCSNTTSEELPAINIARASDIAVDDDRLLTDIIEELVLVRTSATAAGVIFVNTEFTSYPRHHVDALVQLLKVIQQSTDKLCERLNKESVRRLGLGGGA